MWVQWDEAVMRECSADSVNGKGAVPRIPISPMIFKNFSENMCLHLIKKKGELGQNLQRRSAVGWCDCEHTDYTTYTGHCHKRAKLKQSVSRWSHTDTVHILQGHKFSHCRWGKPQKPLSVQWPQPKSDWPLNCPCPVIGPIRSYKSFVAPKGEQSEISHCLHDTMN